jgi:hypothetical protein
MTSIAPEEAHRALNTLLLAAREADARHIQIRVREPKAVIQFSHEDWTTTYCTWTEDYANQVMVALFKEIESNQGYSRDNPPLEAVIARQLKSGIVSKEPPLEIRARMSTVPMWPSGYDVILNLL